MTTHFEKLLAGDEIILAPGAYDALSARVAAQAGLRLFIFLASLSQGLCWACRTLV